MIMIQHFKLLSRDANNIGKESHIINMKLD